MTYEYVCDSCGRKQEAWREMDNRDNAPFCCGSASRRLIAVPNIVTHEWCYSQFPVGTSTRDRVEEAKAADRAYERSWGGSIPSKPNEGPSLAEVAKEFGL